MIDLPHENERLEHRSPKERLSRALELFDRRILMTSSFGTGSAVLLHLWSLVAKEIPVVYIDTGFLFEETHVYRNELVRHLGLRLEVATPATSTADFLYEHGADVYARDPDFCCARNRIDPLKPFLESADAWVSGLRRDQGAGRKNVPILERTEGGVFKVHPIATMTRLDVDAYMKEHGLPEHPLKARRYLSVGCWPCTQPVSDGASERDGRWPGLAKTECGLHTFQRK